MLDEARELKQNFCCLTAAFCIASAVLLWCLPFHTEYFVLHKYTENKYIIAVNFTDEYSM